MPLSIPPDLAAAEPQWFAPHRRADGTFVNPWGTTPMKGFGEVLRWKTGRNPFAPAKKQRPELLVLPDPLGAMADLPEALRVMWLGHASIYVQLDGVGVLVDPVFGDLGGILRRAAPSPLRPEQLPAVDAVVLTHGHRDHADVASLRAVAQRFTPTFVVPLGLSGVVPAGSTVVELDWWQSTPIGAVDIALVPAHHWHRRGLNDTNKALWGGTVLRGSRSLYHSGDTGPFGGFSAIGKVFPHLDVAVMPLGAFEPRWFMGQQHIAPEDVVPAFEDLGAATFLAMHWGTFDLTDEPLDHGVRELLPHIVAERGLDPERFAVVAHGGSVGVGATTEVVGRLRG